MPVASQPWTTTRKSRRERIVPAALFLPARPLPCARQRRIICYSRLPPVRRASGCTFLGSSADLHAAGQFAIPTAGRFFHVPRRIPGNKRSLRGHSAQLVRHAAWAGHPRRFGRLRTRRRTETLRIRPPLWQPVGLGGVVGRAPGCGSGQQVRGLELRSRLGGRPLVAPLQGASGARCCRGAWVVRSWWLEDK